MNLYLKLKNSQEGVDFLIDNKQNMDTHKNNDTEEELSSLERREILKKTGKLIYTAPILALLSTSSDALDPPDPPDSTTQASQQASFNSNDPRKSF